MVRVREWLRLLGARRAEVGPGQAAHLVVFGDPPLAAIVADVPVVLLLTGKADRGWIADNNAKLRAVPATHPNVTVVDWEVLSATCEGRCFYDDGIHLTQSGQNFYADVIGRVLAQP